MTGRTSDNTHAGVLAQGASTSGIGLEINTGGLKATGAGIGTNTFAFIQQSSVANININATRIDNVLTNGDPNALVFVTHVFNPGGSGGTRFNKPFGVFYDGCVSKLPIYVEDQSTMPISVTFNVMVIKP